MLARRRKRPVSQSVSYFTVPPRAHPPPALNPAPPLPVEPTSTEYGYSLPGATQLSQVSCEVNLSQRTGIRVFPVAFCPSFCPLKRVGEAKTRDGPGAGPDHLPLRLRVIAVGPTLYMRQLTPPRFTRSHQTARKGVHIGSD